VKRIVYRGGLKYEKTGLVDGESINDVGFTLGIGLPITGLSNVNIGFELGKEELHRRTWFRRIMPILV
jgi:hypothetical protein